MALPCNNKSDMNALKPSFGFGLRSKFDKYSRTKMALDPGFGHQAMGYYIAVYETFK